MLHDALISLSVIKNDRGRISFNQNHPPFSLLILHFFHLKVLPTLYFAFSLLSCIQYNWQKQEFSIQPVVYKWFYDFYDCLSKLDWSLDIYLTCYSYHETIDAIIQIHVMYVINIKSRFYLVFLNNLNYHILPKYIRK